MSTAAVRQAIHRVKAYKTRCLDAKLCVSGCGRPLVTKHHCRDCANLQNARTKAKHRNHLTNGLCVSGCGRILATKQHCRECADKGCARSAGYKYDQKQRNDIRELFKHCEICLKPFSGNSKSKTAQVIDHCHKTGVIRGALCGGCNMGLGGFSDSTDNLRSAITYLEAHL